MAQCTSISIIDFVPTSPVSQAAGATDATSGAVLWTATAVASAPHTATIAAGSMTDRLLLQVSNANTETVTFSVLGGTNPPAFRGSLGNLTKTGITNGQVCWFGPFPSARHVNTSGSLAVQLYGSSAGTLAVTVRAFRLPTV